MARYEFEEGGSRKFWEIQLEGSSLTTSWGRIGTAGQSKTKSFASEAAAKKEHDKLVAEKLGKGYRVRRATPAPAIARPLRQDIAVYNEATGFIITSRTMGGRGIDSRDKAWEKAVEAGDLIPIELVQDDSFVMRVLVGGTLEAQEEEEWIGRLSWRLRLPDGHLVVAGGLEFVMDAVEADVVVETEYVRFLDVPAGSYRADVYAYLHGVNGEHLLGQAAPPGKKAEPAGAYFRRTRPGQDFPSWLQSWCSAYPSKDPHHEDEWRGRGPKDGPQYIDFLLHLTPLEGDPGPSAKREKGWFSLSAFEARKPAHCPLGLEARDVREAPPRPVQEPAPLQTMDVLALVTGREAAEVAGGPVEVSLERLVRVYRLAWFATDSAVPEIRLTPPAGASFELPLGDVDFVAAQPVDGGWRIGFPSNQGKWTAQRSCREVAARLKGVPDGTVVELMTAVEEPEGDPPVGLMRCRGVVTGGVWRIEKAFPPATQARLAEALALSTQCETGTHLTLADTGEATEVRERFLKEWKFLVKENPLRQDGGTLSVEKEDTAITQLLALEAFRLRYADTWTMPAPQEPFDLAGLFSTLVAVKGHAEGEVILEGGAGRVYRRHDLGTLGERAKARAQEADQVLASLGYTALGDLVCSAFPDLALRAYARPEGDTYGALLHGRFRQESFDFVTRFQRDAGLTTTLTPGTKDDTSKKNFKTSHPKAGLKALHAHHEKRKAELAGKYGPPVSVTADLVSFARALEIGLAREI